MKFITASTSSFILPLKDISYFFCYYNSTDQLSSCQNSANFFVVVGIALYPSLLNLMQVIH